MTVRDVQNVDKRVYKQKTNMMMVYSLIEQGYSIEYAVEKVGGYPEVKTIYKWMDQCDDPKWVKRQSETYITKWKCDVKKRIEQSYKNRVVNLLEQSRDMLDKAKLSPKELAKSLSDLAKSHLAVESKKPSRRAIVDKKEKTVTIEDIERETEQNKIKANEKKNQ